MTSFKEKSKKAEQETKHWKYAAWTLPFVALVALAVVDIIGLSTVYSTLIVVIVTVFFATSVFWWWWALHKFVDVMKAMENTAKTLKDIQAHINEVKKDLFKSDSDRKR